MEIAGAPEVCVALRAPRGAPFFFDVERMMNRELLDAAFTKLADAATLLDSAGEELLAGRAVALAERVNLRLCEDDTDSHVEELIALTGELSGCAGGV
jgi:hypothetical protein